MANNHLAYLTQNDWALLNAKARRRVFRPGEEIIRQGSLGDRIYVVRKGEASVELVLTSNRTILATFGSG